MPTGPIQVVHVQVHMQRGLEGWSNTLHLAAAAANQYFAPSQDLSHTRKGTSALVHGVLKLKTWQSDKLVLSQAAAAGQTGRLLQATAVQEQNTAPSMNHPCTILWCGSLGPRTRHWTLLLLVPSLLLGPFT